MSSLLLDTVIWDLVADASGNIAVCDNPYALAQDVASALRTFQGECYYDTSLGLPYFAQILGSNQPVAGARALFEQTALDLSGVVSAACTIDGVTDRGLTGKVRVTDIQGQLLTVGF